MVNIRTSAINFMTINKDIIYGKLILVTEVPLVFSSPIIRTCAQLARRKNLFFY